MFILKGIEQLEKAIAKAKKVRPRVEFDRFGRYRVSGSKGYYTVICRKSDNGYKTVDCTCKGAEKGLVCYHAAAALSLHVALARRERAASVEASADEMNNAPYLKPTVERLVERVGGIRIN
jgi:uncharacterized Zn finger protein